MIGQPLHFIHFYKKKIEGCQQSARLNKSSWNCAETAFIQYNYFQSFLPVIECHTRDDSHIKMKYDSKEGECHGIIICFMLHKIQKTSP